jgi:hypothetical protein
MILDHVTHVVALDRPLSKRPKPRGRLRRALGGPQKIDAGAACDFPEAANQTGGRGRHVS